MAFPNPLTTHIWKMPTASLTRLALQKAAGSCSSCSKIGRLLFILMDLGVDASYEFVLSV